MSDLGAYTYLGWLLAWSLPVLAGQWIAFPGFLARTARRWLPASLVLAGYFAAADAVGIASGVWTVSGATTTGLRLGVLPAEEALFFVLTTLMVAQTTVLFLWRFGDLPGEPWPGWTAAFGRGPRPAGLALAKAFQKGNTRT